MSMFLVDELRRVATESVVPLLFKRWRERRDLVQPALIVEASQFTGQTEVKRSALAADEQEHRRRVIIANAERAKPPYGNAEMFNGPS